MWMMIEYDERVLHYQTINYGFYIVKLKDDEGLEDEVKKVNTFPLELAVFILSNSKRKVNNFYMLLKDFFQIMFFTPTPTLYTMKTIIGKN